MNGKATTLKTPPPPEGAPPSLNLLSKHVRDGQCRFATTAHDVAPADHRFCGAATRMGRIYCPVHMAVTHNGFEAGPSAARLAWARQNPDNATARKLVRKWGHLDRAPAAEEVTA